MNWLFSFCTILALYYRNRGLMMLESSTILAQCLIDTISLTDLITLPVENVIEEI